WCIPGPAPGNDLAWPGLAPGRRKLGRQEGRPLPDTPAGQLPVSLVAAIRYQNVGGGAAERRVNGGGAGAGGSPTAEGGKRRSTQAWRMSPGYITTGWVGRTISPLTAPRASKRSRPSLISCCPRVLTGRSWRGRCVSWQRKQVYASSWISGLAFLRPTTLMR